MGRSLLAARLVNAWRGGRPERNAVAAGIALLGRYFGAGHHPQASLLRGSITCGGKQECMCQQRRVSNDSCAEPE